MRLVLIIHSSDGYTYSCETTYPVEYESAEQFMVDYDTWKETNERTNLTSMPVKGLQEQTSIHRLQMIIGNC